MVESVRRPIFLRGRCDAASVATNKARLTVRKGDLKGPECQARNRILVVDGGGQGDHRGGPCITPGLEDSSAGRIKRSRCVEDTQREVINQVCVMKESEGPRTGLEGLSKNSRGRIHRGRDWAPQSRGTFLGPEITVSSHACYGWRVPLHPLRFLPIN